jgi:predicted sulfurtransferase
MGGEDENSHDKWRIALFYFYVDLTDKVEEHLEVQKKICEEFDLKGRLRVSQEGINGVLSGQHSNLLRYEEALRHNLEQMTIIAEQQTADVSYKDLDIKYCHLREDLSVDDQLFDYLKLIKTDHVISLLDDGQASNDPKVLATTQSQGDDSHLSAEEWNAKLLEHMETNSGSAILVDARNVYESRVGHFSLPTVPTMLTNTRKYSSDLPQMLASSTEVQEKKEIFLYCTGGVRCEPLSQYMKSIYPDKNIYQLKGGIQTYLKESKVSDWYKGKNFTFDQRRTDPVHFGEIVGRCIVCGDAHDDYDNGHAPKENMPARCCTCRILILVCDSCRDKHRCWGEKEKAATFPRLFCGNDQCIHEGAVPTPEILMSEDGTPVGMTTRDKHNGD